MSIEELKERRYQLWKEGNTLYTEYTKRPIVDGHNFKRGDVLLMNGLGYIVYRVYKKSVKLQKLGCSNRRVGLSTYLPLKDRFDLWDKQYLQAHLLSRNEMAKLLWLARKVDHINRQLAQMPSMRF